MIVNVNIVGIGKASIDILKFLQLDNARKGDNSIIYQYTSIIAGEEKDASFTNYLWKSGYDAKQKHVRERIIRLLQWGVVNLFIVDNNKGDLLKEILYAVELPQMVPVYVVYISRKDTVQKFELPIRVKEMDFIQGEISHEIFTRRASLEISFLISQIVKKKYMTFSQFMSLKTVRRKDPFDCYRQKMYYIPKFLLYKHD